ncbi:MAG: hypothetical protein L0Y38_03295 [Methylococcaceae bacterium]|nr:hypothetical protein [Methylococcaceae bacterium]
MQVGRRSRFPATVEALILLLAATGTVFSDPGRDDEITAVPILKDPGNHVYPITTEFPIVQDYFNQGLILSYGFNHAEAARSFREAARHDPLCAMCYWGEALVLGPNINAQMAESDVVPAYSAVQKALSLTESADSKEKALIQALSARYAKQPVKDRSTLDRAYADAMREVAGRFANDPVIGALFAESLMDLHPWDFWTETGEAQLWTPEIVSTLERVLEIDSNNPLANHLYIHVMEASPHPERALPSVRRLPTLVPGSGHLVHMPAHIYIRIGHYREAVRANQAAVRVDHDYLNHPHTESLYTKAYVPHNYHFLWAAAVKSGQSALAIQAAKDAAARVDPELIHDPGFSGTLQHFWLIPLYTQALFGQWSEILRQFEPPEDLLYARGIRHYARGLAWTRRGESARAEQELARLREIIRSPAIERLSIFDINPVKAVLNIAEASLAGELAASQKNFQSAVEQLGRAVKFEDALHYTEPKDWYLPARQTLGAILLEAGDPVAAEKVFREDLIAHPQNGWSLFGLLQSLKAQGKDTQIREAQRAYDEAWRDADIELMAARF